MKKLNVKIIVPIILVAIVVIGIIVLTKGTSNETTNNVYVEGIETPVSFKDIKNAYDENEARFDELYRNKQVKFTGTIKEISTDISQSGISINVDKITFEEGWELEFPTGFCQKLSQLNKGDKLDVVSVIIGRGDWSWNIAVSDYGTKLSHGKTTIQNRTSIKLNGEEICKIVE